MCGNALFYVEDEQEYVNLNAKPGPVKRTRGAQTSRKRQPVAKRWRKNPTTIVDDRSNLISAQASSSSSEVSQPVLTGPNLSASSSSSSEDEFDSLVKNWNGDISVTTAVEDGVRTKGHKQTK